MADVPVVLTAGQLMELTNIFQQTHLENKQEARLTQAATAIDQADGSVPAYTRTWIPALDGWSTEAVDNAFLIRLAKQTATGDLLEEVRRWTNPRATMAYTYMAKPQEESALNIFCRHARP